MFLLRRGSLEGRLDPSAYHPARRAVLNALRNRAQGALSLQSVVRFVREQVTDNPEGLPYIGLENVESNTGAYIPTGEKESISSAFVFRPGDILFPKLRPYLNKIFLPDFVGICSTEFHVLNSTYYPAQFLVHYLRSPLILNQTRWLTSGNTLPRLQTADIEQLLVPVCDQEAQAAVIQIAQAAQLLSETNRAQARAHLTDLDTYLAQVLGISLPPGGPVPLAERQFRVRFRQVVGQRLDPLYYLFDLNQLLRGCPYPTQRLGPLCTSFATGFAAGHQGQTEDDDPTGIIQIRPTNISADRQFIFNRNIHIGAAELADRPDHLLQPGEVLFNNTNSQELVGKSVVFDLTGPFCCSNHITRLTLHPGQLDPYYLAAVLNMYQRHRVFFSLCTNWNNQSGINADVLRALRLPVPPLAKQQEIAAHLQGIQQEAQTLEQAAYNTLAQARLQIEQLILQPAA